MAYTMIDRTKEKLAMRTLRMSWGARATTLRACTLQLLNFLIALKKHDPSCLSSWKAKPAGSPSDTLKSPVGYTYEAIKKLLSADAQDDAYPAFSYYAFCWNGAHQDKEGMSFYVSLGAGEDSKAANYCIFQFPEAGHVYDYYKTPAH